MIVRNNIVNTDDDCGTVASIGPMWHFWVYITGSGKFAANEFYTKVLLINEYSRASYVILFISFFQQRRQKSMYVKQQFRLLKERSQSYTQVAPLHRCLKLRMTWLEGLMVTAMPVLCSLNLALENWSRRTANGDFITNVW